MSTLVKYIIAVVLWAVFYLVVAFAVAIGFGLGWRLITGTSLKDSLIDRRERRQKDGTGGNGKVPEGADISV